MMLDDIVSNKFHHGNLVYEFSFKEINDEFLQNTTVRKLHEYLQLVQHGAFPNVLFNDPGVPRASRMRIKSIEHSQKLYLQQYLFEKGLVQRVEETVPRMVQTVYDNFKSVQLKQKPAHEPVLKSILMKDSRSVAIELPVWLMGQYKHECLTGHVDLLQVEKKDDRVEIKVMDYKPEGESKFIFCLPQIALYAHMLEKRLKLEIDASCSVSCYIFDRKATWKFNSRLLHDIDDKLDRFGITREWVRFLK